MLKEFAALVTAIVEILLIFRFSLKFFGANPQAVFVEWVYSVTQVLLTPFQFAFPTASVSGGLALEFTTLFALFAYAFLGYVVQEGLDILQRHTQAEEQPQKP